MRRRPGRADRGARRLAGGLLLIAGLAACAAAPGPAGPAIPQPSVAEAAPPAPAPRPRAVPDPRPAVPAIPAHPVVGPLAVPTAACPARVTAYETAERLGGLSGLAWDAAAGVFVAIADDAGVYRIRVGDDAVSADPLGLLADTAPPRTGTWRDAEALAPLGPAGWAVSFERNHRVWIYPAGADGLIAGPPVDRPIPDAWRALAANTGVEALAADGAGGLIAIEEGSPFTLGSRAVWWLAADGQTTRGRYRGGAGFVPGDATRAPDGSLLVLERRPTGFASFTSRVVRLAADGPDLAVAETLLALPDGIPAVNFEGLAVAADGADWRVLLASDDDDDRGTVLVTARLQGCGRPEGTANGP